MKDVKLVVMPFEPVCRPSLALGLLQSGLTAKGISSSVVYANIDYAEEISLDLYFAIGICERLRLMEWIFSSAVFPEYHPEAEEYLTNAARNILRKYRQKPDQQNIDCLVDIFQTLRSESASFVRRVANGLVETKPAVIGCTSVFGQHIPSLALLKQVREIAPEVTTVIGGANCHGRMGVATAYWFPWVDFTFSGEADSVFPAFCKGILENGGKPSARDLPSGILTRDVARELMVKPSREDPWLSVADINEIPAPDFDDYFNRLNASSLRDRITPGLLSESSRGCWWRKCTFCGLNAQTQKYRSRNPALTHKQLDELSERYDVNRIRMVDNIMDTGYLKTLLPQLAAKPNKYNLFYETKTGLTRDQARLMSEAGINWFQPGIEALHDDLLSLMNKGATAIENLQTLKYAREYGMRASWFLLVGFPFEEDSWHRETAGWLPLIYHFQPPTRVMPIVLHRFSEYHENPQKYGITLEPDYTYRLVYPLPESALSDLAYRFDIKGASFTDRMESPGVQALHKQCMEWVGVTMSMIPAVMRLDDFTDHLEIFDTRLCAPELRVTLEGAKALVYRACEPAGPAEKIVQDITENSTYFSQKEIRNAIDELKEQKLILEISGQLLALAIPGNAPKLPPRSENASGWSGETDITRVITSHRQGTVQC